MISNYDRYDCYLREATAFVAAAAAATNKSTYQPVDAEDKYLLNLLYAPRRSRLFSVTRVLTRIENVSYILAWTRDGRDQARLAYGCPSIDVIELPRLKLAFNPRRDHENVLRLYSVDHMGKELM